jgi:hypothetical protein
MTLHPKTLETVPLPLGLHMATYTVMGLFCMFAGGLNLLDPVKYLQGIGFFALTGFAWGYVFGLLMARKEVIALGYLSSVAFTAFGAWKFTGDRWMGLLFLAVGLYGIVVLTKYRKRILEQ